MPAERHRFKTYPLADPKAVVTEEGKQYRFTILADGLIRYEWAEDGKFEDRASTFAVKRQMPVPNFHVVQSESGLDIFTDRAHLIYDKKRFSAGGLRVQVRGNISNWQSLWRYGEKFDDLGGTARTLDGVDGRCPLGPGVISTNGYAAIDDSQSMLFEFDGWVGSRLPGDRIDGYLFAYGHDYREALKAFYSLSGLPPLLPRWSLGNWWSRYHAYTAKEYLDLMDRFQKEKMPLSVGVIDMDWHLVDIDPKLGSGWTGYTWNRELFPDPEGFLKQLHERNLKVTLNVHPADGVRSHEEQYEEMCKALGRDPSKGYPIEFDVTNRKFLDAYFDILHRPLEEQGVDFWWIDWQQGPYSKLTGIDPLWMLNRYHFLDNSKDHKRGLILSRYAGPGSHRYPIGFSGDTIVTWASLDFQPEFTATASNIGYGWWSHDIGGHMAGYRNDELAVRWLQLGVFSPILRLHSSHNLFNTKEPWNFQPAACLAMKWAMQLRHRLIPYLYTMNYISARDGTPLVQPMYWDYHANPESYTIKNQFKFGSELFVAPITAPIYTPTLLAETRAWLPRGRYIDLFTGLIYDGERIIEIHRPLEEYPIFAREGSLIPLDGNPHPTNCTDSPPSIELLVVVGADASFDLFEDDGTGCTIHDTEVARTPIRFDQASGKVTVGPVDGKHSVVGKRTWDIHFLGIPSKTRMHASIDGKKVDIHKRISAKPGVKICLPPMEPSSTLTVEVGPNPQLRINIITKTLYPFVHNAQILFSLKGQIWGILEEKSPVTVKVTRLIALDLDPQVLAVLLEYLCADERAMRG